MASRRVLSKGTQGDDVREVQESINVEIDAYTDYGISLSTDGVFGPMTEVGVKWFQGQHDLVADGWVGSKTWAALDAVIDLPDPEVIFGMGAESFQVKEWQAYLLITGHLRLSGRADGVFGPLTRAGTLSFQRAHRLAATGEVNAETYQFFLNFMEATERPLWPGTLSRGDTGSDVRTLQGNLRLAMYREVGDVDGIYGGKTEAAVSLWQEDNLQPTTGEWDAADWPALVDPIVSDFMGRIKTIDMPFLSERTLAAAPLIVGYFHGKGDAEQAFQDKVHALHVAQGESGGHPLMNAMRWGYLTRGKPQGLFSVMTHLNWPTRMGLYHHAEDFDPYRTAENSRIAGALVYSRPSSWLGFHHWWSVGRYINPAITALGLGIRVVWYCPQDPGYWKNVPAGSNFICNGVNYG